MKLLQFTPFFPPHKGGLQVVAENISKYLVKGKHCEVINITSSVGQEQINKADQKPIFYQDTQIGYWIHDYQVITVPSFEIIHNFPCPKFWTKNFWQILHYIKTQKPHIIQTHTRFFLQTFFGGMVAKWLHKPRVHVEHGSGYVTGIARRKKLAARLYDQTLGRLAFSACNKIISINQANLAFVQKFVSAKKCKIIYNGIEIPNIPSRIKTENNNAKMVFIGRLIGLKAVNILIDACKQLIDQGIHNFSLNIIGDGEEKTNLEHQTKNLQLEKYIHFLGAKNHDEIITQILPQTDILINPSLQEGLPTTVLEGLLAGCIVVATDVGGTKEISNQSDLILVKAGNSKLLADQIQYAITHQNELKGQSEHLIKERFDRNKSAEKYAQTYTALIQK